MISFLVLAYDFGYNILLGRPSLNALDAVISTNRLAIQFPTWINPWKPRSFLEGWRPPNT